MAYSMYRTRDHAGDSGPMSMALWKDAETGEIHEEHNARPRVGVVMRVGSPYARSYVSQDYWQTTYIQEILAESSDHVRFRTGNSEYEWKEF